MKFLLCILIINFLNVDCGLLGDTLTPVTEAAQNNALLDEHQQEKEAKNKGLVTNLVGTLDKAVEPLTSLLGKGSKDKDDKKDTDKKDDSTPKNDIKFDLGSLGGKDKKDEVKKEAEDKKKEGESSTPKADLTTPKVDVTTPKADATTPKVDVATPKADATTPKVDLTTPTTEAPKA